MPDVLRALVVDDEPIARRTLRLMLAQDPQVELIGECDSLEALKRIPREQPDLVFLDVNMPEVDGFQLLEQVGIETIPAVVFVTAHDEHALRAFDVAATDYLLKPFDDARFAATLRRVKAALQVGRAGAAPSGAGVTHAPFLQRFVIRNADRLLVVGADDVDWIEAADYYSCLHVGTRTHLVRQTMAELERRLDPRRFFRLHRSRIVNLERVREVASGENGDHVAVLASGDHVRVGRGRLEALRRRLAGEPGPRRSGP